MNANASLELNSSICLNDSQIIIANMANENFSIKRINDTFNDAGIIFNTQLSLKLKNRAYDFNSVLASCNEIKKIYTDAITSRDQIGSLMKFYNDSISSGMNTSSIDAILTEINGEMRDERYEKVSPLVDKAYAEIINVQSTYTSLNVFYQSTARGFKAFLLAKNKLFQIKNWQVILIFLFILITVYWIYRLKIHKVLINNKMEKLQIRKKTIKDLVMKTQRNYFQYGKISESDYNIKVKKFAELIRDIDRQIPMLQEELAKIEKIQKSK